MEDFNEPRSGFEDNIENETHYRPRKDKTAKIEQKKKKWGIPLALLLIVIAGAVILLYLDGRSEAGLSGWLREILAPEEDVVQLTLPEALFADKKIEQIMTRAVGEQIVEEIEQDSDSVRSYTVTPDARDRLLAEAANNLEERISAIKDANKYPYVVDLSYDGTYKDFYLVVSEEQEQSDQALAIASELFTLAVYYQYIGATAGSVQEVTISVEDNESGSVTEQLLYPNDLNRVAAVFEDLAALDEAPTTPQVGDKVIVNTGPDNLNLRSGPEITYLIIDILRSGTVLEVSGTEGAWLEVITPEGREGWVHGSFVEIYSDDN